MFKRDSFRKSSGGDDSTTGTEKKKRFSLSRKQPTEPVPNSPSMSEPYTPTRRPSTPSRIPAPSASPSSSVKKRSISSIFRSKSSRDVTPQSSPMPGDGQISSNRTKASPSLPAIGRAVPLPSPSPGQSRQDYFAKSPKTPTKSTAKPLPSVSEQQVKPSRVPVTVPSPTHRRDVTSSTVLSSSTAAHSHYSSAATAYTEPELANVIAKDFSSDNDNHEHLRKLASRMSSPDNTDASSVRTFGSRSKPPSPPELGEVVLCKPGAPTLQVDMQDAVPVHVGSRTEAEDVLSRVSRPEREESLRRALGTSPSTWDVDGLSHTSRTTSPAPSSSSPRRSIPASPIVSRETAGKTVLSKLPIRATLPPPSESEAAAQTAIETAIYTTPLEVAAVDAGVKEAKTSDVPAEEGLTDASSHGDLQQPAKDMAGDVDEQPTLGQLRSSEHEAGNQSPVVGSEGAVASAPAPVANAQSHAVEETEDLNEELHRQDHDGSSAVSQHPLTSQEDSQSKEAETPILQAQPPNPERKLSFTGPFASDPTSSNGSCKVSLPPLHSTSRFAPAPYNDMVPRVLRPKMAVEIDFTNGWIPAIRGGWFDAKEESTHPEKPDASQSLDKPNALPRQRVTSWVGSVPVVGRVAGYAGW